MNWKQLLAEITAAGMTQAQIASFCGRSQTAISELCTGKVLEPRHALGERLRQLHKREMAKKARREATAA